MYQLFIDWIGQIPGVSPDLQYIFSVSASLLILIFLLDFFRFLFYICSGGDKR